MIVDHQHLIASADAFPPSRFWRCGVYFTIHTWSRLRPLTASCKWAFDAFNPGLFEGRLPQFLLTLQREKRTYGYFSSKRFGARDGQTTDEIAVNPEYFTVVPLVETLQTIAHEMVHLWQAHFGTPGPGRYHNTEWADKMESIGLMPSSTGQPGGRRVGDMMADYVIPGGRFEKVVAKLLRSQSFAITWYDRFTPPAPLHPVVSPQSLPGIKAEAFTIAAQTGVQVVPKLPASRSLDRSNRVKYSCPSCELNLWGKPGIRVACVLCGVEFEANAMPAEDAQETPLRAVPPHKASRTRPASNQSPRKAPSNPLKPDRRVQKSRSRR